MAEPHDFDDLDLGDQVGDAGRMGSVFRLDDRTVFKKYEQPLADGGHLDRLIELREGLPPPERSWLDGVCAWPLRRVVHHRRTVGFTMLSAPEPYWADMLGERHTRELQHLVLHRAATSLGLALPDREQRLRLTWSLATVFEFFERHGLVYADMSEKNLLWTLEPRPSVYLLDCDNISIAGVSSPLGRQATARNWRDPRLETGAPPDLDSDRYALGLFYYRVFYGLEGDQVMEGNYLLIPDEAPCLPGLEKLLVRSRGSALPRPRASEWAAALETAAGQLVDVPAEPAATSTAPRRGYVSAVAIMLILLAGVGLVLALVLGGSSGPLHAGGSTAPPAPADTAPSAAGRPGPWARIDRAGTVA